MLYSVYPVSYGPVSPSLSIMNPASSVQPELEAEPDADSKIGFATMF